MEKKKKWILILILIIILLLLMILYLLFGMDKTITITFDTNGGSEIQSIEIENGAVVKLPEPPKKEGYKFVGWTNQEGHIVTKGTKVRKDTTLKAEWVGNNVETITLSFDTSGGNEVDNIILEKGKNIILPVSPIREGYTFVGWLNNDGNLITDNLILNKDMTLKAIWVSKDASVKTVKFDTDGANQIGSILVENGKVVLLPINPVKEGYVFGGWVDENGNVVNKDTIITSDITIKAVWKQYVCPLNCTPIGDGSKCNRVVTANMVNKTSCPSGYKLVNNVCLDVAHQYHAISIDVSPFWKCNSSNEYMYSEIDKSGLGAFMWCAKKANKVNTKVCPSGYTKNGNTCQKTETVNCEAK